MPPPKTPLRLETLTPARFGKTTRPAREKSVTRGRIRARAPSSRSRCSAATRSSRSRRWSSSSARSTRARRASSAGSVPGSSSACAMCAARSDEHVMATTTRWRWGKGDAPFSSRLSAQSASTIPARLTLTDWLRARACKLDPRHAVTIRRAPICLANDGGAEGMKEDGWRQTSILVVRDINPDSRRADRRSSDGPTRTTPRSTAGRLSPAIS